MQPSPLALLTLCCALFCTFGQSAVAQSVGLGGVLGSKALLLVDGNAPRALAPGESYLGVKVLAVQGDAATLERDGQTFTLRLGDAPTRLGVALGAAPDGKRVVIPADSGGHFITTVVIQGGSARAMVDTGATAVSLAATLADRLDLPYRNGARSLINTANGPVPAWRVTLDSVRVGEVTVFGVDAVVTSSDLPYVLLGNSFLTRFQMTRNNDQMVLEKRF